MNLLGPACRKCLSQSAPRTATARAFSTTFDGDMARLYLNFFDQAESAWKLTEEIVLESTGGATPKNILDVPLVQGSQDLLSKIIS